MSAFPWTEARMSMGICPLRFIFTHFFARDSLILTYIKLISRKKKKAHFCKVGSNLSIV